MSELPIAGILPVIPTPFRDGRFDERSFAAMIERSAAYVHGYTVLGSTGEAPSMPVGERMRVAERMAAVVPDELTLVVGVTSTAVEDSVELARHAEAHGAAGVLCAAPFYYVAEPDGVLAYLERVDAVLERELVLYDNPGATKIHLGADTVVEWADRLGHLHTVKLTDHDLGKVATWQAAGLAVLGGDDPILLRFLAAGVDGVMVIAPVVLPEPFRRVWDLVRDGDLDAAGRLFGATIAPFVHAFGIGDEIATTKALLADVGVFSSDELRPPLTGSGPDRTALLRTAFEAGYAAFE